MLPDKPLILCRPQSGLNDFLCEIERCCRYAERYDRLVLVDSAGSQAKTFKDSFSRYFQSTDEHLLLNGEEYKGIIDNLEVCPPALRGRVNHYEAIVLPIKGAVEGQRQFLALDKESRQALTFDFSRPHPEPLLVHQQPMGGSLSLVALTRMRLREPLIRGLADRLRKLGRYIGVHVRHTDYQTDYGPVVETLERMPGRRIFLATDNADVRAEFRRIFGERVTAFSALPRNPGEPLHLKQIDDPQERYRINCDAILDLLTLALANRLLIARTTKGNYSGYSLLAGNLRRNPAVLQGLLGGCDVLLDNWIAELKPA